MARPILGWARLGLGCLKPGPIKPKKAQAVRPAYIYNYVGLLSQNVPKVYETIRLHVTPRTGSAVTGYCPLWAWLHSHQPARFCFWELTKQLPRVVTHPGIAPASHSLNFGVLTTPKPVSSQKASSPSIRRNPNSIRRKLEDSDDRTIGEQLRDQTGWISSPDGGR
ncbi:hypothetical protein L3X38_027727 [Prunus dulcis]|uniref:Uncharacterized protein n=1 Tax=Prunus dulcis TaxID=3755 RepID=A0AAD4Z0L8_PRUDU|nr:hypothetical protein L3X38_027727 [Prunus dulcis]